MRVLPVGLDSLLVEVADAGAARALFKQAQARGVVADEIVPGARTVLFDGVPDPGRLAGQIASWPPGPPVDRPAPSAVVEVPVTYDGPDLPDVARAWGMTTGEAAATHAAVEYAVAFCGFAPGFAYCTGLPAELELPRLATPRSRVPAGSVGLAGEYTGIYPSASPGGWRLIARTDLVLWDASRHEPATLVPGTRLRFVAL